MFDIDKCATIKEAWEKLAELYGKVDETRRFQLDHDLNNLDPNDFDSH